MRKLFDGFRFGIGIILALAVFVGLGYYIVKAALPTANTGDKLTASKWNDLINKVNTLETSVNNSKWVDVVLTDTIPFDTACERRYYDGNNNVINLIHIWFNGTQAFFPQGDTTWPRRTVKYNEKNKWYYRNGSFNAGDSITKLQKKCSN